MTRLPSFSSLLCALTVALVALLAGPLHAEDSVLAKFLSTTDAAELVEGATGFGPIQSDLAVAPVMKGADQIGWAYITSDYVSTTGYSGKPIHVMVAMDADAKVIGVRLVKHSEPIVLIGIPDAKVTALAASYIGMDLVAEANGDGSGHELDIISGATVTVMVIDDTIVRSAIKVARALGLGGLKETVDTGPKFEIDTAATGIVMSARRASMLPSRSRKRQSSDCSAQLPLAIQVSAYSKAGVMTSL